jgi:hypothetical protein
VRSEGLHWRSVGGNSIRLHFSATGDTMYFLYLDDSGCANNPNERYFVLGGVYVFERQVYFLNEQLEQIACRYRSISSETVELHAYPISSGKEEPWGLISRDERRQVQKDILSVLSNSHESCAAFACAVEKAAFPNSDPVEIAFEELCRRFDICLMARFNEQNDPQRGIIVMDKSSYETSLQRLAKDFQSLGTRWGVIRNLAEVPMFVDSKSSRLIQLADHIAYAVRRRYELGDSSLLDIVLSRFSPDKCRLHYLIHKTSQKDCMCPACMSRRIG